MMSNDPFGLAKVAKPNISNAAHHEFHQRCRDFMVADLRRSGLSPEDGGFVPGWWDNPMIQPSLAQPAFYWILYYYPDGSPMLDAQGKPLMYRKRFEFGEPRYLQPGFKEIGPAANAVYLPPNRNKKESTLHICEGEKKAVAMCKAGYRAIAIGGMDNWHASETKEK